MPDQMQVFRADALPVSRWANGAGRKADIAAGDGWLIGFAWLDGDAPFSELTGIDRTITLVEGPGFALDIAGASHPVRHPFVPFRFDGGAPTRCRVAGPSRVLNAMADRDRFGHRVTVLDGDGTVEPGDGPACAVVALNGPVRVGDATLERLDAAIVASPTPVRLWPGGRAACILITHAR